MNFEAVDARMTRKFNYFKIISVRAPTEEKDGIVKDPFHDKFNQIHQRIPVHDTKIIVGDCNAKAGEEIFKPVIGNWSLQETSNKNGIRAIDFANNNNMIKSTYFPNRNIHKETQQSPVGRSNNQTDHVLVDGRQASNMMDVKSCRGADQDMQRHSLN